MSLENRKEFKTIYKLKDLNIVKNELIRKYDILYPTRKINSIYLDTANFKIYKLNNLEDVDTYKYRFRYYENDIYSAILEKKFTSCGNKYKLKFPEIAMKIKSLNTYSIEKLHLVPVTKVEFTRSYFKYKNIRITLDENITFSKTENKDLNPKPFVENQFIIEQKILDSNDSSIEKNLLFSTEKYSKFSKSVEVLYF